MAIAIDQQRLYAIDGWLRKSSDPVRVMITEILSVESWVNIRISDKLLCLTCMWVGSTADFAATTVCTDTPMPGESSTCIDWSLTMCEAGHFALFDRLRTDYKRSSMLVSGGDKRKYRRKPDKCE